MKTKRLPTHLQHPVTGKTYRIPYVRTFFFLALIVILLVLAALGRAAPPDLGESRFDCSAAVAENHRGA